MKNLSTNTKQSLSKVFISVVILIYIITTIISSVAFLKTTERLSNRYVRHYTLTQNLLEINKLHAFIDKEIILSRKLANDQQIRKWILQEDNQALTENANVQLKSYHELLSSGTHFIAISSSKNYYLTDITQVGKVLDEYSNADRWFFEAIQKNEDYSLNVNYDNLVNEVRLWINVTVRDEKGNPIALAGSGLYITDFLDSIVKHTDESVNTIMINTVGHIQAHKNKEIIEYNGRVATDKEKIKIYDLIKSENHHTLLKKALIKAKEKNIPQLINIDYDNKPVVLAIAYIAGLDWYNLVLVNADEIMGFKDFLPLILVFLVSAFMLIIAIVLYFNKLITNPIHDLTVVAIKVANGFYDTLVPVKNTNEIGLLGHSFNTMIKEIKKYTTNLEGLIKDRTAELDQSNQELLLAKNRITDSIEYAKLLQNSILPAKDDLKKYLEDYFVIYKPLDIVGGDFYYFKEVSDGFWIAGIDCTGHGVPGAFMTMMVNALVHQIIDMHEDLNPAKILELLHYKTQDTLKTKEDYEHLDNGFDIALCKVNLKEKKLYYAGGGLPLVYSENDDLKEIKGDSLHLGYKINKKYEFKEHSLALKSDQVFYLFTDGILDLPGGPKAYGLGRKQFLDILTSVKSERMSEQKTQLSTKFQEYSSGCTAKDDILVLGFKIKI